MRKYFQSLVIIVCAIACLPATAEQVRQLSWQDLIPARQKSEDYLAGLTPEQKDLLHWLVYTLERLPEPGPGTEDIYKEVNKVMSVIQEAGIDMRQAMAKRNVSHSAIVEELNGQAVRIPGYLLPLEITDARVTEFLLVPYIGACIHVPPPPPNQIVYVKVVSQKGYKKKRLYDPVWVTGKISVMSTVKELYLTDGSADINVGYVMHANRIEPYKQ
jgi:hypothetical protein